MNLYGEFDLSAFFGVETRVLDGEEHICIPKRFNPCIRRIDGHHKVLLDIREMEHPNKDGFDHILLPHIPRSILCALPEADFIKMSAPVGWFKACGLPAKEETEEKDDGIGFRQLAHNPVTDNDIPL